jgi:hypothetical protein
MTSPGDTPPGRRGSPEGLRYTIVRLTPKEISSLGV